jgi:broad specificity phosphatase PhoE
VPVDKVSIEKFAQTIKEKYPQYKDIDDTLLTNSIIEKHPEYKDMVNFNAPAPFKANVDFSNVLNMAPQPNTPNTDAANRVAGEIQNSDKAIGNILSKQKVQEFQQKMDQYRRADGKMELPTPDFSFTKGVRDAQAAQIKPTLSQNPALARQVLEEQGNINPDRKGQIQADVYQLDRGETSPKIQDNVEKLKKGELEYNLHNKTLQKPEGFWGSLGTSYSERVKARDDYDQIMSLNNDQLTHKLETEYRAYDPDEPVNTPTGIGHLGKMIGSQPPQALLAGAGVAMVPGAEEAAPWAAALVASPEIHAISYRNELKSHYKELRDQGVSPEQATAQAQHAADFNANVDMAQGALMTAAGMRLGGTPAKLNLSEGFINAVSKGTKGLLQHTAEEAVPQGALAAGLRGVKNLHDGKPLGEGMTEDGVQTAAMVAALGLLIKTPEAVANSPKIFSQIKQGIAKNADAAHVELAHMVNQGNITPTEANHASAIIQQQQALDGQIPSHITDDDTRIQIQDLIKHKTKLEGDLDVLNKAYHPAIKNKIADIDEQIQKLSDLPVKEKAEGATPKPKPTPGEKKLVGMPEEISPTIELSTKTENNGNQTKEADAQAQVLEQAKGLIQKGVDDGKISDVYKTSIDHPDHFLDFINDQVKGGNEENLRKEFGNELVDLAKQRQPSESLLESRHADTNNDEKGITSGPNQDPLSKSGKRDSNDLANEVKDKGITKIISSDLERAKETSKIVADKTGAKVEHDPNLRTWDIGEFDGSTDKEFKRVQDYFVNHPDATEFEGKKIKETFNQYKDRVIKARTELEKEPASTLLINHSNNMMLWDAYEKNGRQWNEQAAKDYINGEKPEPATLTTKNKDNGTISQSRAGTLGTHDNGPEGAGGEGEGNGVGQRVKGDEPPGKGPEENNEGEGEKNGNTIGISHESQTSRASKLGQAEPERGEGVTREEAVQHGRDLLKNGSDPEKALSDFQKTKKVSYDDISLVRAHLEKLAKETNEAVTKHGLGSPEANDAFKAEEDWRKQIKPMQTEWSKIGTAQQGETDIDTGTVIGLQRAYKEETGRDFTPKQAAKAAELAKQVKTLSEKVAELEKQLTEAHDREVKTETPKTIKEKSQKIADAIRKGKASRPDAFSAATPASLVWDGALEVAAKVMEASGTIAQAVADGIEHIKNSEWYKGLSEAKQKDAQKGFTNYMDSLDEAKREKASKKAARDEYRKLETERNRQLSTLEKLNEKRDQLLKEGKKPKSNSKPTTKDTPEIEAVKKQIADIEKQIAFGNAEVKRIDAEKAKQQIEIDHITELGTRFANKTDSKFDADDAKDIWQYSKKEYLDKGSSYTEMINNVSKDLGLSPEQVRNAITQPKGTKVISDEIYRQNAKRNDAMNEAKRWVKSSQDPKLVKFFKGLPNFFFAAKVFGHGTVGMITHAGTNIFRPSSWGSYWKNFGRQFKYAFGGLTKEGLANYNKAMEDLKNDPSFTFWKRAGLAVDPKESYDDYQGAGKIFGKINEIGERGFNVLKVYRLDMAKSFYDGLSNVEKADPETAKEIAKIVNHSTGTSEVKIPGWTNTVFFAPKLEAARWQGLITDPAKAANTFVNWKKATPAEKVQAKIVARKAGEIIATYMAGLASNAAILSFTGSKQKINFTDPTASDWLKFKAGGKTLDVSGGMEATMRFIATLAHSGETAYAGTKKDLKEKPQDKDYKTIGQQARYKLSPFMSTVLDIATGTDAMGKPLPFSKVPPKKGEKGYTVGSYIMEQQLPIPFAEGIKATAESMKERGMSKTQIKDVLSGIIVGSVSGGTGAKVGNDYSLTAQTPDQKKAEAKMNDWKDQLNITDKKFLPTDIQYDHSTPKPTDEQTAELNDMIKASRQKLFEEAQKDLDWNKMSDVEKKTALETVMKEGEDAAKEQFKNKYPQFTPKRPEMTDAEREQQQEQSEKQRDIQRKISNKARELKK